MFLSVKIGVFDGPAVSIGAKVLEEKILKHPDIAPRADRSPLNPGPATGRAHQSANIKFKENRVGGLVITPECYYYRVGP